jgi:hypothetical protein
MPSRVLAPIAVAVLALAGPAPALAVSVAPPGNSGVDEYLETVPTAGGNAPSSGAPSGGHGHLPAAVTKALAARGADGRATAALAAGTAPSGPARSTPPAGLPARELREPSGSSVPSAIARALGGEGAGGMGVWLPILLALSALGIGGVAVARRRSGSA